MKKIYLSLFATAVISNVASAQNCVRYASDVYTTYSVTSNVVYGASKAFGASTVSNLTLDFYQPTADTSVRRPLIIWAHGGSFFGGTKTDVDVVSLSQHFAKKGYACASINYRVGFSPFDSTGIIPALLRAVQDMKAAIRFFYKDKSTANIYKIDTNNIFIGGSSAGAITALHVAYLNKTCEINPYINQSTLVASGGIDGTSGNQCYSSKVKGVINLCGALGKYGWLEAGDVPLCSMHGTTDGTVIYGQGKANPGIPIMYLDGSRMIAAGTQISGVNHKFYTWYGAGHVPYAGSSATQLAYMDTTVNFVRDYLVGRLGCTNTPLQLANTPAGVVVAYPFTNCTSNVPMACDVSVRELAENSLVQTLYPNPSNDKVTLAFVNATAEHTIDLMDVTGKIIKTEKTNSSEFTLEKSTIQAGIYFLKVIASNGQSSVHKIVFN
jgi:alpha/beta superfamily hydrolase